MRNPETFRSLFPENNRRIRRIYVIRLRRSKGRVIARRNKHL